MVERARTVLFVDVVDSVRLIADHKQDSVRRWADIQSRIEIQVVRNHGSRIVKSTGDGVLIDFADARDAVAAGQSILKISRELNDGVPDREQVHLRCSAASGQVFLGERDIYGHSVNLAARLLGLAGADEFVICAETRDRITDGIDCDVYDLGDCYLRNIEEPVRAYLCGSAAPSLGLSDTAFADQLSATMAILPLESRIATADERMLGHVVAEETAIKLTRQPGLRLISQLSSRAIAGRALTTAEITQKLGADYIVSGAFDVRGQEIVIRAELVDTGRDNAVMFEPIRGPVASLFSSEQAVVNQFAETVFAGIITNELQTATMAAMPNLRAYTMFLSAVNLLNRLSPKGFDFARDLLEALIDRGGRQALPHAWLGNWHVMRVQQGWSSDVKRDAYLAATATKSALAAEPNCAIALTIDGAVNANLLKRLDIAEEQYAAAIASDPNHALSWLLQSALFCFMGRGPEAVQAAERAIALAPCDPNRYLYDSVCASAYLTAGDNQKALDAAKRSMRANRVHASCLRAKIVAEWRLGLEVEARQSMAELLKIAPNFSVSEYLARSPNADFEIGREISSVLRQAGAPE
ncbi:MAG: adenylate/guanylate cyclase domain-containing protein [Rhodobacter sp.]|nr:adenylate/guanylate cyclase domain-containing protein [Rhodobacter sp.]